jgi:beta-glucosidase
MAHAATPAAGDEDLHPPVAHLTTIEKLGLVSGADGWRNHGVARLGIPALKTTDGPNGARGETYGEVRAACFPCGGALGATWDPDLVAEVGAAIAEEVLTKSAHLLLAPTVNLHRIPRGGRNFECYSEDPLLTGALGTAFVTGVQSKGVGATVKHFVANDQEHQRNTISVVVDERTLRELYLRPFEMIVRDAAPVAVMSSYNRINGVYASDHHHLLTEVLRDEWGFDGMVVSDWFGTMSTDAAAAGVDLEMPAPPVHFGVALADAIEAGTVDIAVLDAMVTRVLRASLRSGAFDRPPAPERAVDSPAHRALIRRAAAAGTVLLRNTGALPLPPGLGSLAVIGPAAAHVSTFGGGSAQVATFPTAQPLAALRAALPSTEVVHEEGCRIHRGAPRLDTDWLDAGDGRHGLAGTFVGGGDPDGAALREEHFDRTHLFWQSPDVEGAVDGVWSLRLEATFTPPETGEWLLSVTSAGQSRLWLDGEVVADAWETTQRGDDFFGMAHPPAEALVELDADTRYALRVDYRARHSAGLAGLTVGARPPIDEGMLDRAVAAARGADAAVVVVGLNPDWETEGRDRESLRLPGAQDELVAAVAAVNDRTVVVVNAGSVVEMPWADDVAAVVMAWYAGEEAGTALADVLTGAVDPGGRLPTTFPRSDADNPTAASPRRYPGVDGEVHYEEGLCIGHRWYEAQGVEPRFPFGHGLSYTSFEVGAPEVVPGDPVVVRVPVRNRGARPGSHVVQVYVRGKPGDGRPPQELAGFAKIALEPGAGATVTIAVPEDRFAVWSTAAHRWEVVPGRYELAVGSSSADIHHVTTVEVPASRT